MKVRVAELKEKIKQAEEALSKSKGKGRNDREKHLNKLKKQLAEFYSHQKG